MAETICPACGATIPPCDHFDWCPEREINKLRRATAELIDAISDNLQHEVSHLPEVQVRIREVIEASGEEARRYIGGYLDSWWLGGDENFGRDRKLGTVTTEEITPETEARLTEKFRQAAEEHFRD